MVPLKYLSNLRRTPEMPLINCETSLQLKWSANYFFFAGAAVNQIPTFTITDTKRYGPVVTLSTQNNIKLIKQLEFCLKRTINWNIYQSKETNQAKNKYLKLVTDSSFQGVNRLFVSSFENEEYQESYKNQYLPNVQIKNYNIMIDGRKF